MQVPPMPASLVRSILEAEISPKTIHDVFHSIDLSSPLGSASIAQVSLDLLSGSKTCLVSTLVLVLAKCGVPITCGSIGLVESAV